MSLCFGVNFSYSNQDTVTQVLGMTQTSPIEDVIGFGKGDGA
jgi:hypothetical protein